MSPGAWAALVHTTRMTPRRGDEILNGGSIYWVIKRLVQVRQRIIGLHEGMDEDGRSFCAIELDPDLVPVEPRSHRPFQGWRYLKDEDAPRDLPRGSVASDAEPPPEMAAELRKLGLL